MVMTNMSSSEGDNSDSDVEMLQDRKEEKEDFKRRRRRQKEETTYGIFGDMDNVRNLSTGTAGGVDSDIASVGMNRRQRRKLQQERLSKPVGFVNASVNLASTAQRQTTAAAQEDVGGQKDEEVDKGMEGLALNLNPPPPPPTQPTPAPPPPPPKPVKLDRNFGNWEKHTKGIGSKLLAKMGFTGRLGKQSTGVTRQIEVKLRPNGIGLGFGNFKESSTLKINREIEADRIGISTEEEDKGQTKIVSGIPRTREGSWKKGKKVKPKLVMADDIFEEEKDIKESETKQQLILDMRGPQTRIITDAAELAQPVTSEIYPPALGEELLHNVSLVVSLSEAELRSLLARVTSEEARAAASLKEVEEYKNRLSAGKSQQNRLKSIRAILNKANSSVSVTDIAEKFSFLKENYSEEYGLFDLDRLVPTLGAPIVKKEIAEWKPLLDPSLGATILAQWKLVLCSSHEEKGEELEEGNVPPSETNEAYSYLIQDIVLPKVRRCLVNEWNPQENPEEAIALLDHLSPVLPYRLIDSLALETVLPKLEYSVKQWDARKRDLSINVHKWILPWRQFLGSKLSILFPLLRRKMASALTGWSPPDPSALASLSPWLGVFDSRSMEALLSGPILPKLVHVLRDELVIDPSEQDLGPFRSVMDWKNILPHVYLASLFEGEFFGKWIAALHYWLSEGEANPEEVAKWYQGWKSLFPKSLQEDKRIEECFNVALYLMETRMERMALPEFSSLKRKLPRSFQETLKKRKDEDAKTRDAEQQRAVVDAPTCRPLGGSTAHEPLFRDVMATYAEEHGVEFVPKLGRSVGGKQLYTFGGIPVLVDQLVRVEIPRGSGSWTPISVEVLMQKVKQLEK